MCVEEKRKKRNRGENQRWSKNLEMQKKMMHMNNNNKTTTIDRMECRERKGQDLREVKVKGFYMKGFCIKSFISQVRLPDF